MTPAPIIAVTADTHVEHSRFAYAYVFRGFVATRLRTRYFQRGDGVWQMQQYPEGGREWSPIVTVRAHRKVAK